MRLAVQNQSDEQLVRAYRHGDRVALETLIHRHLRPVFRFAYRYVGNVPDADDVVQEVWVKVWRNLKRFDASLPFTPWLFGIAKHACLDWLKRKKALPFSAFENEAGENVLLDTMSDPAPLPSETANHAGMADRLTAALLLLAPKYRLVIYLRHNHQRTFREIAQTLDEPLHTVKSRYRRARLRLRECITDSLEQPR